MSSVIIAMLAGAMLGAAPGISEAQLNPRAVELFERDWVLNRWGVKRYDGDGDGVISLVEANAAAAAFKRIADGDGDGRVTPYEYDRAREFIIARY